MTASRRIFEWYEHFRSACVWKIGRGKIFYFRPGHEIYPVYKQELPLRVIENACACWRRRILMSDVGPSDSTGAREHESRGAAEDFSPRRKPSG